MNQIDIDTLEPDIYIPLFRAKKLNSDKYIIGQYYYNKNKNLHLISYIMPIIDGFKAGRTCTVKIDVNTLAINFPDMIDSEQTKIFSSLSKNGNGGDYLKFNHIENYSFVLVYQKTLDECLNIKINKKYYKNLKNLYKDTTVIGIKE